MWRIYGFHACCLGVQHRTPHSCLYGSGDSQWHPQQGRLERCHKHESYERHVRAGKNKYLGELVISCSKLLHLVAYHLL